MASNRLGRLALKLDRLESSTISSHRALLCLRSPVTQASRSFGSSTSPNASPSSTHRKLSTRSNQSVVPQATFSTQSARRAAPPSTSTSSSTAPAKDDETQDLTEGFSDEPMILDEGGDNVDWARSFNGLGTQAFSKEVADVLLKPLDGEDVEIKPDGIVYLPEIKYRRILNKAFGPGGWGLAPRSETIVTSKLVTREYALVVNGRLASVARGEQEYFTPEGVTTAAEGCKSNAMMRCCKDLGVASELWDPRWIRTFLKKNAREIFVEHATTKRRRKIWVRAGEEVKYPYKEVKGFGNS